MLLKGAHVQIKTQLGEGREQSFRDQILCDKDTEYERPRALCNRPKPWYIHRMLQNLPSYCNGQHD